MPSHRRKRTAPQTTHSAESASGKKGPSANSSKYREGRCLCPSLCTLASAGLGGRLCVNRGQRAGTLRLAARSSFSPIGKNTITPWVPMGNAGRHALLHSLAAKTLASSFVSMVGGQLTRAEGGTRPANRFVTSYPAMICKTRRPELPAGYAVHTAWKRGGSYGPAVLRSSREERQPDGLYQQRAGSREKGWSVPPLDR